MGFECLKSLGSLLSGFLLESCRSLSVWETLAPSTRSQGNKSTCIQVWFGVRGAAKLSQTSKPSMSGAVWVEVLET